MPDHADAAIAEWEKESPPDAIEPEPVAQPSVAEPPAETPRGYSLDDALPYDPRIPESFRGKPLHLLLEDRLEKDKQAKNAGFEKNAEKARADAFKTALEALARKVGGEPDERPRTVALRPSEQMRRDGTPADTIYKDPDATVDSIVATTRAAVHGDVEEQLKEARQRLQELENQRASDSIKAAFMEARPANMSVDDWQRDGELIAFRVHRQGANIFDRESYKEAAKWLDDQRGGGRRAAVPVAPQAPAPPVGNGTPAPVVRKPSARVSTHVRSAFNEITDVLNEIGVKQTTDTILEGMSKDSKYKEMFQ